MNKAEQLLKSMLEATERRAEQAEGDLYDARVDNRMLWARAEQAEATLNAIERLLDVPGMGTGWEAIKALKFRAEQAEAEMAEWKVQCHRERTKLEQAEAERDALTEDGAANRIARMFHDEYERLAPSFGYETREASRKRWEDVPEANRLLMEATVHNVIRAASAAATTPRGQEETGYCDNCGANTTWTPAEPLLCHTCQPRATTPGKNAREDVGRNDVGLFWASQEEE